MPSKTQDETGTVVLDVRNLSQADLGRLGMQQLAYVKPVMVNACPEANDTLSTVMSPPPPVAVTVP